LAFGFDERSSKDAFSKLFFFQEDDSTPPRAFRLTRRWR
jgi:hypothetical protein